jgi:ferredoxin
MEMEVTVDAGRCIGCGMCAAAAPEVFRMAGPVSSVPDAVPPAAWTRACDAANGCPVNAITVKR